MLPCFLPNDRPPPLNPLNVSCGWENSRDGLILFTGEIRWGWGVGVGRFVLTTSLMGYKEGGLVPFIPQSGPYSRLGENKSLNHRYLNAKK